jgi:GNAT superfamily N-acetyltransferase
MRSAGSRGRELCAAGCRRVGEPIWATASRVDVWMVLEVPGPWPEEVTDALPEAVRACVQPILENVPRSRLLFIKGSRERRGKTISFYVAITDEWESRLYRFELRSYEELAGIELFALLAEDPRFEAHRQTMPLYLVCTHGTHDRCCAKFGFPIYSALARRHPERVRQSSHVGGDRFAANIVCLPHGLYYGHLDVEEAETVLERTDAGRLYLPRWRGRTPYPPPVQAAEHFLRQETGENSIGAYRLWEHHWDGDATAVRFVDGAERTAWTLRVEPVTLEARRFATCGAEAEGPVRSYRLASIERMPHAPGGERYVLRPAGMGDYGFIYRLRAETLRGYLPGAGIVDHAEQDAFFARFDVARHRLVSVEGQRAGAISVLEREDALHLANLHLAPDFQHRGLGTALVEELQRRATERAVPVTLNVLKVNPAVAFYQRLGFRIEGEQGIRHRMVWSP